jgi:hypothetical protein
LANLQRSVRAEGNPCARCSHSDSADQARFGRHDSLESEARIDSSTPERSDVAEASRKLSANGAVVTEWQPVGTRQQATRRAQKIADRTAFMGAVN